MTGLEHVYLSFGGKPVLTDFSVTFPHGRITALTGPSGCGKSSVLRLLAGLQRPDRGSVQLDGRVSYAFQEPRLLPGVSALDNVNLVLGDTKKTLSLAQSWLEAVGLGADQGKTPEQLSGGMRQRVSLVRALAYGGEVFLLDEPFAALDTDRKQAMMALVREKTAGKTVILVTHDPAEAALADGVVSMPERPLP